MKYLLFLFQIIIIKYTAAQVLYPSTLGGNNCIPNVNNAANIPIAANFANGLGINNNIALANIAQTANLGVANANLLNNLGNVEVIANGVENVANAYSGNIATLANYANVVQPPREYGIEFSSDALEMGGQVAVSGRMPFNANVAVKGSVPAQGQGSVSYKCDDS